MELYLHQKQALNDTADKNRVAYYHDMGLGKTFTGAEKMIQLGAKVNLVICQKSKIQDWIEHFIACYGGKVFDLTNKSGMALFKQYSKDTPVRIVGVINYELAFRRPELLKLTDFTLMLDESSLIQNEKTKRSKFILKLQPSNVILLSGTPTSGKYENLLSQINLLGWNISETTFWNIYVDYHWEDVDGDGHFEKVIDGYKNVDRLKRNLRKYGCHFLKTDEVMDLPAQIFTTVKVPVSKEYKKFRKDKVVTVGEIQLVGDNTLTAMLYERQLCGVYSTDKLEAFKDLVKSTEDRLIVFYNFTCELALMNEVVNDCKPVSIVNGEIKNLTAYEDCNNSITFIQYQAGAMGLNLQKANKIIYFTPPLSSELYEQSKKRINRIGQNRTCYYYNLTVTGSVEERIYSALDMRKDYTDELFRLQTT